MNDEPAVTLTVTRDEAIVLFEFFARFDQGGEFALGHDAESVAFTRLSAQLEKMLVEPFRADYVELLDAARERVIRKH